MRARPEQVARGQRIGRQRQFTDGIGLGHDLGADPQRIALGDGEFQRTLAQIRALQLEEHQRVAGRPLEAGADVGVGQCVELVERARQRRDRLAHRLLDPAVCPRAQRREQLFLAGEIAIRRRVAAAEHGRDLAETDGLDTAVLEHRHRRIEDRLAAIRDLLFGIGTSCHAEQLTVLI